MNSASALKPLTLFLLGLTFSMSPVASADTDSDGDGVIDSIDVDDDNDGLIELHSLAEFNMMRFDKWGLSLIPEEGAEGNSEGCGYIDQFGYQRSHCLGYELVADLDFDTNANGEIDQGDEFCNYIEELGLCEGWKPIGGWDEPMFQAIFDGNGHTLSNFYINRPEDDYVGIWGRAFEQTLSNLKLTGPLTSVTGRDQVGFVVGNLETDGVVDGFIVEGTVSGSFHVGGIVGELEGGTVRNSVAIIDTTDYGGSVIGGIVGWTWSDVLIESCISAGNVTGKFAGGIVGILWDYGVIRNSLSVASVEGMSAAGGIAASMIWDAMIENSLAVGNVSGVDTTTETGGLVGILDFDGWIYKFSKVGLVHNHWATDTTGEMELYGNEQSPYMKMQLSVFSTSSGATLDQLECPTHADASFCQPRTRLYMDWDESLWDFGSNDDLPGMMINGTVYRPIQTTDGSFDIIEG